MENEEKKREKVSLDMSCRCSEEGRADADARRQEIWSKLTDEGYEILVRENSDFVSTIIASLEWDFNSTYITMIACDQWFGVTAENKGEEIFVPCDRVEDGLASIWQYLNNKKNGTTGG